jgi:hypothetical protein
VAADLTAVVLDADDVKALKDCKDGFVRRAAVGGGDRGVP